MGTPIRALLLFTLLATLASCGQDGHSKIDVKLLSTDVHVSVAQHPLVLPFIALEDYAYRKQSFSLDRKNDGKQALDALDIFLRDSADPNKPLELDGLTVVVRTYGWNDADMRQRQVCPLLTREWARSVCDNPWAAIQQALPANRFRLVDLRRLQLGDPQSPDRCRENGEARRPFPQSPGTAVMVCEAMVWGGADGEYYLAAVRIDGDLGALWTVWRHGQNGETAEAMAEREGKAIISFVGHGVGKGEGFPNLLAEACRLRRPGASDGSHGTDCGRTTLSDRSQKW
jgi:hypothetical protein